MLEVMHWRGREGRQWERRDKTLRGGQNKGSASAGERIIMEGVQRKTEANNRKTGKCLKLIMSSVKAGNVLICGVIEAQR